jgi:hypothetical protein
MLKRAARELLDMSGRFPSVSRPALMIRLAQALPAALLAAALAATPAAAAPAPVPKDVATRFYKSFTTLHPEQLGALYAPDVQFQDSIFQYQDRAGVTKMWTTLLGVKPAPVIRYSVVSVAGEVVHGQWIADYVLFGHKVHNVVSSTLTIRNGRIVKHTDEFPFTPWLAQVLGLEGTKLEFLAADVMFQKVIIGAMRLAINGPGKLPPFCEVVSHQGTFAHHFDSMCKKK